MCFLFLSTGGDFHNGLDYIVYNHGLNEEDAYPYVGHDQTCDKALEKTHEVRGCI